MKHDNKMERIFRILNQWSGKKSPCFAGYILDIYSVLVILNWLSNRCTVGFGAGLMNQDIHA